MATKIRNGFITTGNSRITGSLTVTVGVTSSFTGSYIGDGAGLYNIPASGIVGLNLSQIASGSVSASISPDSGLQVNTNVTATSFTGSLSGSASTSTSASYALSSSFTTTASLALTASYVTASNVIGTVTSASYALSASYAPSSVPSGPFGISNSSGVYTYYTSLSASIAAASSGQVIEMFADITETGSVTLKSNITIQGNGHTYTYLGNTGNVFTTPTGTGTYTFVNMNINRANTATSTASIFHANGGFSTTIIYKFISTTVSYTTTTGTAPITSGDSLCFFSIDGLNAVGNSSGFLIGSATSQENISSIKNSIVENTGTGGAIQIPTICENCYIKTVSGGGIRMLFATEVVRNCTVISTSGTAVYGQSGASAYDTFAFSNTGKAFETTICYNCTGQTTTGNAFYAGSGYNVTGKSTTGNTLRAFFTLAKYYNSSFYSSGTITVYDTNYGAALYNCSVITDYNNVAGHAISIGLSSGNPDFVNNFIQVANTSANCIKSTPATFSAKIVGNVYKGATTPVNSNVVQLTTNTQDNQGNIIL
jgi:hypothetical protein